MNDPIPGSILGFVDPSRFPEIDSDVSAFLAGLLIGEQYDTVVAVDRKGERIMRSFFEKMDSSRLPTLISDNDCEGIHVSGKRVLVFDDSIHTGKTILCRLEEVAAHRPASLSIGCLLINRYSRNKILARFPRATVLSCRPTFKTYALQRKAYLEWEMTYLDGLEVKDNPDSVQLHIRSRCLDLRKVYSATVAAAKEVMDVVEFHPIRSSIVLPNHRSITFILRSDSNLFPEHLRPICEHDLPKVRCFVTRWAKASEITFMPLINPRFRSQDCTVVSADSSICPKKQLHAEDREICALCVIYSVHFFFINEIKRNLIRGLRRRGVTVSRSYVKPPSFKRLLT
jgi:hypothetical protein